MYTAHFGLNAAPFSITPDPHYLYLSVRHREALAHLLYGVNEGPGFVLLTGEVGTGKTTLCRSLIEQLPENVDVALLLNPRVTSVELLATLFDELRISYTTNFTLKDFIDQLNSYLLTAHAVDRRTVLILDEAQNLSTDVLEQVRLLTNLETSAQKLLQIILVGQPELNQLLKRNNLRQLAQRITARYHLLPLSLKDTQAYINHRLAISGAKSPLFTEAATRRVYRYSSGVPRLINIICDRALLGGYVNNENPIDTHIVRKAVQEVRGESLSRSFSVGWLVSGLAMIVLVAGLIWWWYSPVELSFLKLSTQHLRHFLYQRVLKLKRLRLRNPYQHPHYQHRYWKNV
ncbi:Peptidoglycan-binding domain 1 [Beggiatoa sp. PS]|nr:Peptidoglycan-binding domain 1 [Beggiatoa sp. PS]